MYTVYVGFLMFVTPMDNFLTKNDIFHMYINVHLNRQRNLLARTNSVKIRKLM